MIYCSCVWQLWDAPRTPDIVSLTYPHQDHQWQPFEQLLNPFQSIINSGFAFREITDVYRTLETISSNFNSRECWQFSLNWWAMKKKSGRALQGWRNLWRIAAYYIYPFIIAHYIARSPLKTLATCHLLIGS